MKEERESKEIILSENYSEYTKYNFLKEPGGKGLQLINQDVLDRQKSVFTHMLSQLGKNFMNRTNLFRIPLPIQINDERTMLQT